MLRSGTFPKFQMQHNFGLLSWFIQTLKRFGEVEKLVGIPFLESDSHFKNKTGTFVWSLTRSQMHLNCFHMSTKCIPVSLMPYFSSVSSHDCNPCQTGGPEWHGIRCGTPRPPGRGNPDHSCPNSVSIAGPNEFLTISCPSQLLRDPYQKFGLEDRISRSKLSWPYFYLSDNIWARFLKNAPKISGKGWAGRICNSWLETEEDRKSFFKPCPMSSCYYLIISGKG